MDIMQLFLYSKGPSGYKGAVLGMEYPIWVSEKAGMSTGMAKQSRITAIHRCFICRLLVEKSERYG
jgi:hypothetical protein